MPDVTIGGTVYPLPADDSVAQKVPSYNSVITALAGIESGSGTAFPSSPAPANNDRFYRSDRDIEYFYDGTRWLSTTKYTDAMPYALGALPYSATSAGAERISPPYAGTYDLWLEEFQLGFFVLGGTALGASHKWVSTLNKVTTTVSTTIATVNIDSGASGAWRTSVAAIGALLGTTHLAFQVDHTKTGTPGTLYTLPRIIYRLVG